MEILAPVTGETFEDHFINNSWATPQDQINAGYPLFIQPANPTGEFLQVIDVGVLIDSSVRVSLLAQLNYILTGADVEYTISLSVDGVTYTDYADTDSVYASNFRYVKIFIEVTSDGIGLLKLNDLKVTIGLKTKRDSGNGTALAADSGGTTVTFYRTFKSVESIVVTALYDAAETKGITAIYDFAGTPDPTTFKVLLHSNLTGTRIDGDFSWVATGY